MDTIQVVATIYAKPGSESLVEDILRELIAPTRAEAGCVKYELFCNSANPSEFVFIEEWISREALDAHIKTTHFIQAGQAQEGLLAKPTSIVVLTAL